MPQNAKVTVFFGPYEACGCVNHYTARLEGLETSLMKEGHEVEFEEMKDLNSVELWVNGERIFTCKIQDLDYGGDGILDENVQKAVAAVQNAF
ncbi:UPF0728 protein v1g117062-like [Ylistrum balloti]|uniref:UPF0728 protein v1g117062-like n=1 Tax=Ylistrum balloti TaxID=509963 RepID=UPI002905D358|nr:UPF0728 protein v1g117062-like [Ylistrum balloti]